MGESDLWRKGALRKLGSCLEFQSRYDAANSERAIEIFEERLAGAFSGGTDLVRPAEEPMQEGYEIFGIAGFDVPAAAEAFNDPGRRGAARTNI
jgi:hypothetical protein